MTIPHEFVDTTGGDVVAPVLVHASEKVIADDAAMAVVRRAMLKQAKMIAALMADVSDYKSNGGKLDPLLLVDAVLVSTVASVLMYLPKDLILPAALDLAMHMPQHIATARKAGEQIERMGNVLKEMGEQDSAEAEAMDKTDLNALLYQVLRNGQAD